MNDPVAEAIRHRHPKEWVFFWLTTLITVAVLLTLLLSTIFRIDVVELMHTEYIENYRAQHSDAASLTDEEILLLLPADEQQVLDGVSRLHVPIVVLVPVGFFILFVFATGRS